jgi:hypothetical protein
MLPITNLSGARVYEMPKMIPQVKNNGRNCSRLNAPRATRPASAGQQSGGASQNQWQRNYDHYCNLAQANNDGDAVTREQYWQHAEHFLRLMNGSAN